jgi:catechol 2,3-dioxygenase-like lactoylglutathione lyase family enzyme
MIAHLSLGVADLARARRFYDAVLPMLGYARVYDVEGAHGYGATPDEPVFWINQPLDQSRAVAASPGTHVAFAAPSRKAVDKFHATALGHGARDNGAPGLRDYTPTYYAAFVFDPDGHAIEAVCFEPE